MSTSHSILLWNCRSLCPKVNDLKYALCSSDSVSLFAPYLVPRVVALTECHISIDTRLPTVPLYSWSTFPGATSHGGGLALLCHHSVSCTELPHLPSLPPDTNSAIMYRLLRFPHRQPFIIGVVYLSPSPGGVSLQVVHSLFLSITVALSLTLPLLVLGDFNLHHPLWLCPGPPSPASNYFAEQLLDSDLTVLNPLLMPDAITRPTIADQPMGLGSIIDLVITNDSALISSMSILPQLSALLHSDHQPIMLELGQVPLAPPAAQADRPRVHWWCHDDSWHQHFPAAVEFYLRSFSYDRLAVCHTLSGSDAARRMDECYEMFETAVLAAAHDCIGVRRIRYNSKHWFSYPGVLEANRELRAAYMDRIQDDSELSVRRLRFARRQWASVKQAAIERCWGELCSRIQSEPSSRVKWTLFKRTMPSSYCPLSSITDLAGNPPVDHRASLRNLAVHITAASSVRTQPVTAASTAIWAQHLEPSLGDCMGRFSQYVSNCLAGSLPPHPSDSWNWTWEDVAQQCTSQRTQSAPGPDSILPVMLTYAGDEAYRVLAALFNFSWHYSVLPRAWREANMHMLYKGSGSRSEAASFRPVSLTSIIIRTFEHLIYRRLSLILESSGCLHIYQFGFRREHSCLDAMHLLLSRVRSALSHKCHLPVVFLDLKKAFDRVSYPYLLRQLHLVGITGKAWRWIHAFLSDRRVRVTDHSEASDWYEWSLGVPQGSVLSPLLFSVFINSIMVAISKRCPCLSLILFADDISIAPDITHTSLSRISKPRKYKRMAFNLQLALNILTLWCEVSGEEFSSVKSQIVVFSRSRSIPPTLLPSFYLCGFRLSVVDEYQYLGVWFHRNLNWKKQEQSVIARARRDQYLISRVINAKGAPQFPAIRQLCISYLRARCTYALEMWQPSDSCLRTLQALFLYPMLKSLGLPRFSHHLGALADTDCVSFVVLRQQLLLRFLIRACRLPATHPTHLSATGDMNTYTSARAAALKPKCLMPVIWEALLTQSAWIQLLPSLGLYVTPVPAAATQVLAHVSAQASVPVSPSSTAVSCLLHFTREQVDRLALPLTHLEWRNDFKHPTTAPLQLIKTHPGKSTYLYYTTNPLTSRLARLRHNRVFTQLSLHRFGGQVAPQCTWPWCRRYSPVPHDTVTHILLRCGRHRQSRTRLVRVLHDIDPTRYSSTSSVSLATALGEIYPRLSSSLSDLPKCQRAFKALADYFYHITLERGGNRTTCLGLF